MPTDRSSMTDEQYVARVAELERDCIRLATELHDAIVERDAIKAQVAIVQTENATLRQRLAGAEANADRLECDKKRIIEIGEEEIGKLRQRVEEMGRAVTDKCAACGGTGWIHGFVEDVPCNCKQGVAARARGTEGV